MTRIGVDNLLTAEQHEFFRKVAEQEGLSLEELLRRIVDAEYKRLFFTERTKRKEPEGGRLRASIQKIYADLKVNFGDDFDRVFRAGYEEFLNCKSQAELEDFNRRQPWVIRKW